MVKVQKSFLVFIILFINYTNSKSKEFLKYDFADKLLEEMEKLDPGDWTLFITKTSDRHWTFRFRRAELNLGDKVFVWSYFIKDGVDHLYKNEECTVTGTPNKGFANPIIEPTPTRKSTGPPGPWPDSETIVEGTPNKGFANPIIEPTPTPKPTGPPGPCLRSVTMVEGKEHVCKSALIFSEDFQNDTLQDLAFWDAEIRFPKDPDYPFNVYTNNGTMALKDGRLVITPVLLENGLVHEALDLTNECTGRSYIDDDCKKVANGSDIVPPVATGKITTRKKFNFKFGIVEVRAKMPAGRWLIPEITLEPHKNVTRNHRYESGLIRIAFVRGNEEFSDKLYGGAVLSDEEPERSLLMEERHGKGNWTHEFHNYTVIWSPDGLTLLVDGVEYGFVDPGRTGFYEKFKTVKHARNWVAGGSKMAPLDQLFYISLGLRVGGLNDFPDSATSPNNDNKPWRNDHQNATLEFWQAKENWFKTWHDANLMIDSVKVFAL